MALIRWDAFEAVQTYDMRDGPCFLQFVVLFSDVFYLSLFPLISEGEALGHSLSGGLEARHC